MSTEKIVTVEGQNKEALDAFQKSLEENILKPQKEKEPEAEVGDIEEAEEETLEDEEDTEEIDTEEEDDDDDTEEDDDEEIEEEEDTEDLSKKEKGLIKAVQKEREKRQSLENELNKLRDMVENMNNQASKQEEIPQDDIFSDLEDDDMITAKDMRTLFNAFKNEISGLKYETQTNSILSNARMKDNLFDKKQKLADEMMRDDKDLADMYKYSSNPAKSIDQIAKLHPEYNNILKSSDKDKIDTKETVKRIKKGAKKKKYHMSGNASDKPLKKKIFEKTQKERQDLLNSDPEKYFKEALGK